MKIACLSFSERGKTLGRKIVESSTYEYRYTVSHFANDEIDGGIKSLMAYLVKEYDGLVFISATGIAIRLLNPYIVHKAVDPAVVVVDDMGNFSISLLSGHVGGANKLARWIGDVLNAIPIITTASDNRGIESIDLFALRNDYHMVNMESVKEITAMMVNGKKIGFYSEMDEIIEYDNLLILDDLNYKGYQLDGLIIVSSQLNLNNYEIGKLPISKCILIPRNINIGIGCRKGIEGKRLIEAIDVTLKKVSLSTKGIKALGTVEVKKDEIGIIEAAEYFNCPLKIFTLDEIKKIEDKFEKSQFVKTSIGVYSVSEPSAYLLGGNLLVRKLKYDGITVSVAKEEKNG